MFTLEYHLVPEPNDFRGIYVTKINFWPLKKVNVLAMPSNEVKFSENLKMSHCLQAKLE